LLQLQCDEREKEQHMEIPIRSADAESSGDADDREAEHLGPPLLALAIVVTVLFLGAW
jgi:hypothetical protein